MPVINPFGVVAGTLSAGTTKATLGEVVFSNSNGVSFGVNGQTMTASVVGGGGGNTGSISAGTTRATLGEVVFSNSNGLSFGVNGQTITGSYTVPSTAGLLSNINVSAGTTSNNLSNVVFSNSNNVTFGLNGSTVTASVTVATSLTNIRVSAGTTSNLLSAITFSNSNNVSFGIDGSTITASVNTSLTNINISAGTTSNNLSAITFSNANGISFGLNASTITASHNGLTTQTDQTLGLYAVGNTTGQSSSSTFDARTISLVGQGIASVGYSNGSVNVSVSQTVQTQGFSNSLGMSDIGNTSGTSGVVGGTGIRYVFAGGANITLSQSVNGQSATLTISGAAGGGGNTGSISAGTTRATLGEVVFSNSNGVSFGVNGQTVTASIATSLTNIRVSAGTTSNLLSDITFSNSNGISFGLNASTITASYTVPTVTNSSWTVSDNGTSGTVARLAFTNLNNVTLSLSTGAGGSHTIVGSINTSLTNINISAGTTSNNLSAVTFSNSNGISFGLNASTITASYTVPGTLSVFAVSNTTQSTSGTIPFSSLQFNGAGIASVGVSNGSVIISVPAGGGGGDGGVFAGVSTAGNTAGSTGTVSTGNFVLVGSNGITLSQSTGAAGSAATVTILGGGYSLEYFEVFPRVSLSNVSNMTATLLTQRPILLPFQLFGSLSHNFLDIEVSRATSGSNAFTMQAAIYTFVNSTQISRLASLQNVFSNTDTGSISGLRRIRLTGWEAAGTNLTPGQYVMMLYNSAAATASMNYSYRGGITASPDVGVIGGGTNVVTTATSAMSNGGFRKWHGLWSTTTASPPNSMALSDISQHTRGLPIYFYMART